MSFSTFDLNPDLLRAVDALGFTVPTPIQKDAIPSALQGRDVGRLAREDCDAKPGVCPLKEPATASSRSINSAAGAPRVQGSLP